MQSSPTAERRSNPLLVEGQIIGGFSNGLGNALYEESTYDEMGQPPATTLADYTAPTAPSMPDVKLEFLETPSPFACSASRASVKTARSVRRRPSSMQ